jgi:LacI family transcriptional regulator
MSDVAAKAGVSKATVSLALSGARSVRRETRRRVAQAASELQYVPPSKRVAKVAETRTLGILLTGNSTGVGEEFFTRITRAFQEEAERENFQCVLSTLSREQIFEGMLPSLLMGDEVEALVVVGITNRALLESCQRGGKAGRCRVGRRLDAERVDAVLNDDFGGIRSILEHLKELGHRDIAFIGGAARPPVESQPTPGVPDSLRGSCSGSRTGGSSGWIHRRRRRRRGVAFARSCWRRGSPSRPHLHDR